MLAKISLYLALMGLIMFVIIPITLQCLMFRQITVIELYQWARGGDLTLLLDRLIRCDITTKEG